MKKLLISMMLKDNSIYLKYLFKIMDLIKDKNNKYNIEYIFYTNNIDDKRDRTLILLNERKEKNIENITVIHRDIDKNILSLPRIKKLYFLREDFLKIIKKLHFDFILMLDSDIMFNMDMIEKGINIIEKNNFNAICACSITYNIPMYYDIFSLSTTDHKNYKPHIGDIKLLSFNMKTYFGDEKYIDVESAFGGFFITRSEIIKDEKISYLTGNYDINNDICEHKNFNSHIKGIKMINNINPYWIKNNTGENEKEYEKTFNIIKDNNSDNRKKKFYISSILICVFFLLFFLFFLFKKK